MEQPTPDTSAHDNETYRAAELNGLLMNGPKRSRISLADPPLRLPDPVFPQFPEKAGDVPIPAKYLPKPEHGAYRQRASVRVIRRALRGWLYPFVRSRVLPGTFHPFIAYLFTDYKCNVDCHYCWAFNNKTAGMTEDVARRSIDWLYDNGCRVLALMGGEVLIRPKFAHKVVYYAASVVSQKYVNKGG